MALRTRAAATGGCLRFDAFVEVALYTPAVGYYAQPGRARVGRSAEADFATATTLGPLFGELLAEAATGLLPVGTPADYAWVEVGNEQPEGVLAGVAPPFASAETRPLGAALSLPPRTVLFANELLDAQPFRRFRVVRGAWRELGVTLTDTPGGLVLTETIWAPTVPPELELPADATEGTAFDWSSGAEDLLRALLAPGWSGAFVLPDYGRTVAELVEGSPGGTARAYHRQTLSPDLLAQPGAQDLTCHVAWDRLEAIARAAGFTVGRERQEAFFVRRAPRTLARVFASGGGGLSPARRALNALLHPAHYGHAFQVLFGNRG